MRKDEAIAAADELERQDPAISVIAIINGVGALREARIAAPAWAIPAQSWMVVCRHGATNEIALLYNEGGAERQIAQEVNDRVYASHLNADDLYVDEWLARCRAS